MKKWIALCAAAWLSPPALAADAPATLQWSHRVELSVPLSGVVQTVQVAAGDQVKKGQVLLTLDSTIFQARVAESTAEINRLDAETAEAKRDLDRTQELYTRTVASTTDLDQARLRVVRSQSMLTGARARLRQNQKALDDATLRAPFDAVVILRQVEPGQSVAAGLQPQTLLVLAKAGEMIARLHLAAAQLDKLKTGQAVTVTVGDRSYPGRISLLGLEPLRLKDESAYPVEVTFAPAEQLRAGAAASVRLQ
ncbi:MAG TPA: efflux RND transporter periplasmic adaptor subunit [Gallionellaceae bacterium]|nr:efflux RND transporter periplasmic adaptor subunit [Gallionellaceae bacterium]